MTASPDVLSASNLCKSFGGLKAVQNFSLQLRQGDLQGLIGPNGAGKTTLFNLLTGVYTPDAGVITLAGQSMVGLRPSTIAAAGLSRTFQNIRLFSDLSVLDNVRLAGHVRAKTGLFAAVLRSRAQQREELAMTQRARELLAVFHLERLEDETARNLCYGDQRRLEIVRALATQPKVLLLDEPAAGMNSQEKVDLAGLIRRLRDEFGLTILLIEHDMGLVMNICEKITVLDYGQIIAVGTPAEIQCHPQVIQAYLGDPAGLDSSKEAAA